MKIINNPSKNTWNALLQRPVFDASALNEKVAAVLADIQQRGDEAVMDYTEKFDGVLIKDTRFDEDEVANAEGALSHELRLAIQTAAKNIEAFHTQQINNPQVVETMKGVKCWRKSVGIEKVGIYIPGGTAPLFSTVLMLGIPARLAGCRKIVLCSPPDKFGKLPPAIVYAAKLVGVTHIFKIGGVQAIGAMAFGTASVPKVYKIFGPGNQYVTCAKQLVQQYGTAIDMPAGPSEVCVLADETANPAFVAADLLSQAEHGADSQVLLVTTSESLIHKVQEQLRAQLPLLSRQSIAEKALANSTAIYVDHIDTAIEMVNEYAAEHLIISCHNDEAIAEQIINAGSIFLGNYSPESVGDYASGTNHTLPTNGYARAYSGVSLDSFVKKITFQKLTQDGLTAIANTVELMADAEGLDAHKNAVTIRRMA